MQTLDYSIQPLGISSVPGSIRDSFDSLPADRHLSAAWPFRYRRYARARSEEGPSIGSRTGRSSRAQR